MTTKRPFRKRLSLARRFLINRPKGFYVYYPFFDSIPETVEPYPAVERHFRERDADFTATLASFVPFLDDMQTRIDDGGIPWANSGKFPQGDIVTTYCLLRRERPSKVIEIGSGTSTHVIASALEDNGKGAITCIDPQPRREITSRGVTFHQRYLSNADEALVADLSAGDVLFVDSSHLFIPGGDVDIEFNRLFPALPKGALVHVHDIFLPDGYPLNWFEKRYAEQNALIGWILSGYFEVVFPVRYAATRLEVPMRETLGDRMPADPTQFGGSIWLRKV